MTQLTLAGLSLRDLEYALAVRRLRHFGRAATFCNVSQPTLSEQIKKLEGLLGLTLFERTRHRVETTARGEAILLRAERLLAEARGILDLSRDIAKKLTGALSLGAIETLGPYYLPWMLHPMRAEYPRAAAAAVRTQDRRIDGTPGGGDARCRAARAARAGGDGGDRSGILRAVSPGVPRPGIGWLSAPGPFAGPGGGRPASAGRGALPAGPGAGAMPVRQGDTNPPCDKRGDAAAHDCGRRGVFPAAFARCPGP